MANPNPPQRSVGDLWWQALRRIETKIDTLLLKQQQQGAIEMTVQDDVNALVSAVAANTTVVGSVQTLLTQLSAMLTTLKGQIADPAVITALDTAVSALQSNNAAISAAVVANTPAA